MLITDIDLFRLKESVLCQINYRGWCFAPYRAVQNLRDGGVKTLCKWYSHGRIYTVLLSFA